MTKNSDNFCCDSKGTKSNSSSMCFFSSFKNINKDVYVVKKEFAKLIDLSIQEMDKDEYTLNFDDLQQFLNFYLSNYNNFYSERFKYLDVNYNKIENFEVYKTLRDEIIKSKQIPNIVYEIIDIEKGFFRPGRSAASPADRMKYYLTTAFNASNFNIEPINLYNEIRNCGSKENALKRFKILVRYVFPSKNESRIMEEFLTIYRNRANNTVGYDLKINNEYNKIVGDLFRRDFLSGALNPLWRDVPPDVLKIHVLYGYDMQTLESIYSVSSKTIRRRFSAYGFGLRGIYDLTDARAFFLKPIIIEGFKKGLTQEEFFEFVNNMGINIFNQYDFTPNIPNPRGDFYRRTISYIWNTGKEKEARYNVLADYIISVINRCDITPSEAIEQLKKFITFKYDREFDRICSDVFNKTFVQKRDEIFKPLVKELIIENKEEHNIFVKIAIGLNLCEESSPTNIKESSSAWVKAYVERNFGSRSREGLINNLTSEPFQYESLKDKVFNYMEDHPLDRPQQLFETIFQGENIETIRHHVKEWKLNNREKIFDSIIPITSQMIAEVNLDKDIEEKTIDLLEKYISLKELALNIDFKGVIAGGIYLVCQILNRPIYQKKLMDTFNISMDTISKWYHDIQNTVV